MKFSEEIYIHKLQRADFTIYLKLSRKYIIQH